jgi:calcineurin-like phosphoesterase family protein
MNGNQDKIAGKFPHLFARWSSLAEIHDGKQGIVLCHYAMRVWRHHARGAWHLYGHSHGNLPARPLSLSMDRGVDARKFQAWHFDELQAAIKAKVVAREQIVRQEQGAVE